MQSRRFTISLIKPILTISLIVLLAGVRFICDLGTAISTSQCLTQTNNSSHSEPGCTDGECHDEHDRGCTDGSSPTSSNSPQHHCCTNWFVFTTEPNAISHSSSSHELVLGLAAPPAPMSLNGLSATGYRQQNLSRRHRAPNYPLYLATHAILV